VRFPDFGIRRVDVRPRLEALRERPLNFDPDAAGGPGWEHDDYRQPLPAGTWAPAAQLSRDFAFSDPSLVEAHFDDAEPFEGRDMLLVLHALGLRIYVGVRVGSAGEETRSVDDREARVSFWNYCTLEGHVEAGRRDYEV
jgi:hypothetical protein